MRSKMARVDIFLGMQIQELESFTVFHECLWLPQLNNSGSHQSVACAHIFFSCSVFCSIFLPSQHFRWTFTMLRYFQNYNLLIHLLSMAHFIVAVTVFMQKTSCCLAGYACCCLDYALSHPAQISLLITPLKLSIIFNVTKIYTSSISI